MYPYHQPSHQHQPRRKAKVASTATVTAALLLTLLTLTVLGNWRRHLLVVELRATTAASASAQAPPHQQQQQQPADSLEEQLVPSRYRQRLDQLEHGAHGEPLLSAMFSPLRISHCSSHMPQHWAPCQKIPNVDIVYAEEVIYPPFVIRIPGFVNQADRDTWLGVARKRGWTVENEAADSKDNYQVIAFHPHGQNFVIANTRYTNNPYPDNWNADNTHCMGYQAELAQFVSTAPGPNDKVVDELFLDNGPQSAFFQHWLDHTSKIWAQGMHLLTNDTTVVATAPSSRDAGVLTQFWHWLAEGVGLPFKNILMARVPSLHAKRLIYSCRCPFIHPYHQQRWREWAAGPTSKAVPISERKVVLYFSRSQKDKHMSNGGRRVINEDELLAAINATLQRRHQGEELVVFDHSRFPLYKDLVAYINTQVRAIVGPHGGAMMNVQFAAKDTFVLEFQHHGHVNEMVWENAAPLRVNYWTLIYRPESGTDMRVNVAHVLKVLDAELGKEYGMDHFVAHFSNWKKTLREGQPRTSVQ